MAFDAFMTFTKGTGSAVQTDGETLDATFSSVKAFAILEFNFGAENNVTIGSSTGGGGAGKAVFKEFTIKKPTDTGSTSLFQSLVTGGHYQNVNLYLRKSGASGDVSGAVYMKFAFGTVMVKSINWSGAHGDDEPAEEVVFEYGQIAINYQPQDQTGKFTAAPKATAWNRVTNTSKVAPAITLPISEPSPAGGS